MRNFLLMQMIQKIPSFLLFMHRYICPPLALVLGPHLEEMREEFIADNIQKLEK